MYLNLFEGATLISFPDSSSLRSQQSLSPERSQTIIQVTPPTNFIETMWLDVCAGLNQSPQKILLPTYLYDHKGSQLYEQITALREYYLTRTEAALLEAIAPSLSFFIQPLEIIELGSGSSIKTRILLEQFLSQQFHLRYIPVDVSSSILEQSAQELGQRYPALEILALAGIYEDALAYLQPMPGRLFLFLGSTMGNFPIAYQDAFFKTLYKGMQKNNALLIGFDLQPSEQKPVSVIESAYNDQQGVTAAFNLNILTHLNQVLGMNFDLTQWHHRAIYNTTLHRIEMHLHSLTDQSVTSHRYSGKWHFKAGETILTEISRKFDMDERAQWFKSLGFHPVASWTDPQRYYGMMLLKK
jgi:L-histidine Nalpha-methyltransferase